MTRAELEALPDDALERLRLAIANSHGPEGEKRRHYAEARRTVAAIADIQYERAEQLRNNPTAP